MDFDKFLEAIEIMIDEKLKGLKFCYIIDGTITEVVNANTYKVNIFDSISAINSMNGNQYIVGDIVEIMVRNGNYSDKKILCKR